MQYIVQGYNPYAQQWETLEYQTEAYETRTAYPLEYMAICAMRVYEEWGIKCRVVVV
jgi:hypothetical protein